MPPNLIFLLALIVGGMYLYRWLNTHAPAAVRAKAKKIAIWAAIGLILFLVATGRLNWLVALVGSLLVGAQRLLPLLRYAPLFARLLGRGGAIGGAAGAASAGSQQNSSVSTDYLDMNLDHDSGRMTGSVRRGRFTGRNLSDLALREKLLLLDELRRDDPESVALLETYLDRTLGADWRDADAQAEARDAGHSTMSRDQAYEVLGLEVGASDEQIREAHRRLIQRLHPDRGGSGYLAATINRAKEVLLAP